MRTISRATNLHISNLYLDIKDKEILKNVSTSARSGKILAILGPTGSGKTTLLNVIAGRQKYDKGSITLNGSDFNKRLRRRLAFVQQQDVFFSQLTLMETLQFTAHIRMPENTTEEEKMNAINGIVDDLDIRKCLNTVIGDIFVKGLSGGEKKRASIACELLVDSDILLLDEPTSGLDSSTARTIMKCIQNYANIYNKMFIITIHQPSSSIFHMFDQLLLLSDGQVAYNGSRLKALPYFEDLGLHCEQHHNPADFLSECLKSDEQTLERILTKFDSVRCQSENTYGSVATSNGTEMITSDRNSLLEGEEEESSLKLLHHTKDRMVEFDEEPMSDNDIPDKWLNSWWTQFKVLLWRSLKQNVGVLLQGFAFVQALVVGVLCCLIYYQVGVNFTSARDVMGLIFFCVGYWTFLPALAVIASYPAERPVINKDRASGAYRLSAYYLAKTIGDFPEVVILPSTMYILFFWVGGFGGAAEFFATLGIMMWQTLACYGLGLLISVTFTDIRKAITSLFCYLISMYLLGGYFSRSVPYWMAWIKYCSIFYYPYSFAVSIIMYQLPDTLCNETSVVQFPQCADNSTLHVTATDVLWDANIIHPVWVFAVVMIGYSVAIKGAAYLVLRFKKTVPV